MDEAYQTWLQEKQKPAILLQLKKEESNRSIYYSMLVGKYGASDTWQIDTQRDRGRGKEKTHNPLTKSTDKGTGPYCEVTHVTIRASPDMSSISLKSKTTMSLM